MDFLNVLAIKKIAVRKACTAERTATIKHKHYVRLTGPDGDDLPGTRGVGTGLVGKIKESINSQVTSIIYAVTWRMGWDSNPRDSFPPGGFQDRCLQPLGHPSSQAQVT